MRQLVLWTVYLYYERLIEMETEQCLEILLAHVRKKTDLISVRLENSRGMISAEDVYAPVSVPSFPKSAVDGYAVKSSDTFGADADSPVRLKVLGELDAGDYYEYKYVPNSAVRVMTGAYIPEGFDSVIMQEYTDLGEREVSIFTGTKPYQNYCEIGEDIKYGERIIKKHERISELAIGVLASVGITEVSVTEPLKTAVIATGSELARPGEKLEAGKIYDSISYILCAEIKAQGLSVASCEICPDDEALLEKMLDDALDSADIVITTGGISAGRRDIVPKVLKKMGAEVLFRFADIQPGTPTMASVYNGKIILSLSGNPYAALANFELYFWSTAAAIMQCSQLDTIKATAVLESDYRKINKHKRRIRAYARDGKVCLPTVSNRASVISDLLRCNCFVDLEKNVKVSRGDRVNIVYFKGSSSEG